MHEKYPSVLESKYVTTRHIEVNRRVFFHQVCFLVFYQSAERFAGNMEVRKDDYKSWDVSDTEWRINLQQLQWKIVKQWNLSIVNDIE